MMRKCSMFMGKKKEPLRGKGLFAESVADLRARRHLIRAEGAAPRSEDDHVIDVASGRKGYVGSYSVQYLEGAEIEYVDQLMGGGFTIQNPNAVRTCGCGHSFQTADSAGEARSCSH